MTQAEAIAILKTGANVFLTGEPGSGKTYTINQYVHYLRSNGIQPAVTASTGIAATHIGGVTIHSWSGIGIKSTLTKRDLTDIITNKRVVGRIKKTKVLIIDEISMLSAETFTSVEKVCRTIRASAEPFGGLQVVLVGDFFQLPPIQRRIEPTDEQSQSFFSDLDELPILFAFGSPAWRELNPTICYLNEQHRQEDTAFLSALNAIRSNQVTSETRSCFNDRVVTVLPAETVTKLYPHNANVDQLNDIELNKLTGTTRYFEMQSRGAPPLVESLKRNCLSPENLILKIDAKVMFTKNHPEGKYVNGTLGEVLSFNQENGLPMVKTRAGKHLMVEPTEWVIQDDTKILASISQLPLRLAWAITVHKSQGMSLDAAVIDLRQAFEYGQGYVALSRVRTLNGLYLLGFNDRSLEVHPLVSEQDARFRTDSELAGQQLRNINPTELIVKQTDFIIISGGKVGERITATEKVSTYEQTRRLLKDRKISLDEVAKERGMTVGTIISHLEKLVADASIDAATDLTDIKPPSVRFETMKKVLEAVQKKDGQMYLSQAKELLGSDYSFDEIRLVRLFL